MKKKVAIYTVIGVLIMAISMTYGKWEFLTQKYANEFIEPIERYQNKSNSWLELGITKLKVFHYSKDIAQIFLEDGTGNKWILNFKKGIDENWTVEYDGLHNVDIIDSKKGGSADQLLYWY